MKLQIYTQEIFNFDFLSYTVGLAMNRMSIELLEYLFVLSVEHREKLTEPHQRTLSYKVLRKSIKLSDVAESRSLLTHLIIFTKERSIELE